MTRPVYLVDSNICIYILKDAASAAARRLGECEPGTVAASAITYAEVARGIDPGRPVERRKLNRFFALVPVVPFDQAAASAYAAVPFRRGTFDRLIAAHALALGLVLVTNNEADFADIPELRVENWARL